MDRRRLHGQLTLALMLAAGLSVTMAGFVPAAEVRFVGTITDGPSAPTALTVGDGGVAALEPFAGQIALYSADGVRSGDIAVNGRVRGLARLDQGVYLYCDQDARTVMRADLVSGGITTFLSAVGLPADLVTAGSEVFVLDSDARRVIVVTTSGAQVRTVQLPVPAGYETGWISDIAVDPSRGILYGLDQTHAAVHAFDLEGNHLRTLGGFGTGDGEISRGGKIACDPDGWLFATDRFQGRVAVYRPDGSFVLNVDPVELGGERLAVPTGFALDESGFLYVAATEGAAIHVFHLDKAAAAPGVMLAQPVAPHDGETMPANDLLFVAGVRFPAASAGTAVVDFRLHDLADLSSPVAEIAGVPVREITPAGEVYFGTANWKPRVELTEGRTYAWQARVRDLESAGEWMDPESFVPSAARLPFELKQNVPNPFNPRTEIHFSLATGERAELAVFDIRGRLVWRQDLSDFGAGRHTVVWQGQDNSGQSLPSGIYFYRLTSGSGIATRKMVLAR